MLMYPNERKISDVVERTPFFEQQSYYGSPQLIITEDEAEHFGSPGQSRKVAEFNVSGDSSLADQSQGSSMTLMAANHHNLLKVDSSQSMQADSRSVVSNSVVTSQKSFSPDKINLPLFSQKQAIQKVLHRQQTMKLPPATEVMAISFDDVMDA